MKNACFLSSWLWISRNKIWAYFTELIWYMYAFSFKDHLPVKDHVTDGLCVSITLPTSRFISPTGAVWPWHLRMSVWGSVLWTAEWKWRMSSKTVTDVLISYNFVRCSLDGSPHFLPVRMCLLLNDNFKSFFKFHSKICMGLLFWFCFYI